MNPLDLLSTALGYLMEPCYLLTGNWWIAIFLFTVFHDAKIRRKLFFAKKFSIQFLVECSFIKVF